MKELVDIGQEVYKQIREYGTLSWRKIGEALIVILPNVASLINFALGYAVEAGILFADWMGKLDEFYEWID